MRDVLKMGEMCGLYRLGYDKAVLEMGRKTKQRYGCHFNTQETIINDGMSMIAEEFVAKYLGKKRMTSLERHDPATGDVEGGIQVRWTQYLGGRLILRKGDRDDQPFVLVCGEAPDEMTIRGWLMGYEGKKKEYVDAPKGRVEAWMVPQKDLHEIATLKVIETVSPAYMSAPQQGSGGGQGRVEKLAPYKTP